MRRRLGRVEPVARRLSADAGAGARRRLDPGAGRQRGLSGRRPRRGAAVAMNARTQAEPRSESELLAAVRDAARQEQFLEVVSAEEARTRFERHLDLAPLPGRTRFARRRRSAACWRTMLSRRSTCRRSTAPMSTALRCAPPTPRAPPTAAPKRLALNPEVIACGHAPTLRGAARHRHHHRHRRRGAARRRRRGDGRAHRADRGDPGDRTAPRRGAGAVHLLCRLRHRARRNAAAQGPDDRLARDRHAGGVRACRDRRGAAAEGRGALDRRRAGRARR